MRRAPRSFERAVYGLVRRIPPGRVVTYGQVAALVGVPRAARAVGQAMRRCPAGVPWHRVVNGRGGVSRRPGVSSMLTQRLLLAREGVRFVRGRVDLARYRWTRGAARPRVDIAALPTA
jgi:methylated-DNA-protein-cysteine methyltransferase-like protein